ncbi:hypothetical protein Ssi03_13010 [Sphaerisporangium siamense]|uniref:Uncharacterized protein n=1 Tax=Sphaerisporangium siamense TaxID=795645 RepID=A0A7W7D9U7_9ACTN|nr:hypothetical protein [Sphaerisporangium siamense]MBB4702930.1 hypothetical protein [Sphaerisporangium siamense]GII83311.1 hypothetical protein Ssi03_13010 [Sphaerisporangium siamense]
MGGCGTSLEGTAIFEVYENGVQVHEYDWWVRNYITVQQGVAERRYTPEQADWSGANFHIKRAGAPFLDQVEMEREELADGKVRVSWTTWDYYEDGEVAYTIEGKPLEFTYDPYGGLTRYTLTLVHRESADDPIPESWNGVFFGLPDCPLGWRELTNELVDWINKHTLDAGVSGDLLVTPYGADPGVSDPIATREFAVRKTS